VDFLSSPDWTRWLESELLPWIDAAGDLGDDVLEVGPGPGLTTDLLRERVPKLTAVELDPTLAGPLAERLAGTNVEVICADATRAGLESGRFSAATCFSMLHHIPSAAEQDALFAELHRVLRPGALLVGADSRDSDVIRDFHVDDTFVPIDPEDFEPRLAAAGFDDVALDLSEFEVRFSARRP
jgi:SAM-dependent methyltransferase